jgi:hypothetical protein
VNVSLNLVGKKGWKKYLAMVVGKTYTYLGKKGKKKLI